MKFSMIESVEKIGTSKERFIELFRTADGSSAEIYKPIGEDLQTPHDRDEYYVIISGSGEFVNGETRVSFEAGDLLFVKKGVEHRFENFTEDFATWVIFV